jgi:hypothetical protein
MRKSFPFIVAILCAAVTVQAAAAMQGQSVKPDETPIPRSDQEPKGIRTADWGFATPQMIPLDSQPVRSWGAAELPGPRNTHASLPHGGPVTAGDRFNMPGRE